MLTAELMIVPDAKMMTAAVTPMTETPITIAIRGILLRREYSSTHAARMPPMNADQRIGSTF